MTIATIATSLSTEITPGSGGYAARLTIAATGTMAPAGLFVPAVYVGAGLANVAVTNLGRIEAAHYGNAVYLKSAATLTNAGTITGPTGLVAAAGGTIANDGVLFGRNFGAALAGATVENTGLIYGVTAGIAAGGGDAIVNRGVISGGNYAGLELLSGSTLVNFGTLSGGRYGLDAVFFSSATNAGVITGTKDGVYLSNHSTLANGGFITAQSGLVLTAGGAVQNSGTIAGGSLGVALGASGSLNNYGLIAGGTLGLAMDANDMLVNAGTITGATGILLQGAGTIVDGGFIGGTSYAISAAGPLELVLAPSATFSGLVKDASGDGTLALTGDGSLALDGTFSGFSELRFWPGASWTLEGHAADFADGQTIAGFSSGDVLVLDGFNAVSYEYVPGSGLQISNGATLATIHFDGTLAGAEILVRNVAGGSEIFDPVAPCFCAGTRIETEQGLVAVEDLRIGARIRTAFHGVQPIKWIGRRSYGARRMAGEHLLLPVRIRRHAIALNVPSRDLFVSPDHAICEGGGLVHAWRLCNDISITQPKRRDAVRYFHLEFERHEIIFAENCPVESFIDEGCRSRFHNAEEFHELYPDAVPGTACLPRVHDGFLLERIRARLAARAGAREPPPPPGPLRGCIDDISPTLRGWAQDVSYPERPVELLLWSGNQCVTRLVANAFRNDLRAAGLGSGCHAFALPLPDGVDGAQLVLRRLSDGAPLGIE